MPCFRRFRAAVRAPVLTTLVGLALAGLTIRAQPLATAPNRLPARPFDLPQLPARNVGSAVAIDGTTAVIGAPGAGQPATGAGSVYVFLRSETAWTLQATLTSPDPAAGDAFGAAVAISGDTIVVGAPGDDEQVLVNVGSAYVFTRSGATWTHQVKLHMPGGHNNDDFGRAVAISGNTAIVGAPLWDPAFSGSPRVDQGQAFVYTRSGTTWLPAPQPLATADGQSGDAFGASVGVDGDFAAVGAPGVAAERGAVKMYRRSGTAWGFDGMLTPADPTGSDLFGWSTAVRGDLAVVGAPRHDPNGSIDQGAAYLFRRGATWTPEAKLTGRDGRAGDQVGSSVALSAAYAAVGARFSAREHANGPGQVLLFKRAGALWNQIETLMGDTDRDEFGRAVAIGADDLVIGSPSFTSNVAGFAGAAHYFPLDLLRWRFEAILPGAFVTAGGIGRDGLHTEVVVVTDACCALYGIDRVGQGRSSAPIVTPRGATAGSPGDPTYLTDSPAASADGGYVAFASLLPNLLGSGGDTNGSTDVFVKDRVSGAITRVSLSSAGAQGNGGSFTPSISADGRFVAFASGASNLVTGDTNGAVDVFVHDRTTGATTRVSVATGGAQGNGTSSAPAISGDGRFVAFVSEASNLIPSDPNGLADIFIHDRELGITSRASGANANGPSRAPAMSFDGNWTVFESDAGNIAGGDANGFTDIFVFDYFHGFVTRVSASTSGAHADGPSQSPAISADGRYIAFSSVAANLSVGDTDGLYDVFVRDMQTGVTSPVGRPSLPGVVPIDATAPAISHDGQTISFLMHPYLVVRGTRPLIASVAPVSVLGGTFAIGGTSFTEQLSAWADQTAAAPAFVSPTQVTASAPARPAGPAAVSVGLSADAGWHGTFVPKGLDYIGDPPTITSVSPSEGPTTGGTVVSIAGSGFVAGGTTVTFGGVAAAGVTVLDASHVTAVAPAGTAGAVNVVVATAAGPATLAAGYSYFRQFTLTLVRAGVSPGTVTSAPGGISCGADCSEVLREGTQVTLTAAHDSGGAFASWSIGGCGSLPVCTFTLAADLTVTATYGQPVPLTVNRFGPGTVTSSPAGIDCGTTCSAFFGAGAVIRLTATPDANAQFGGWNFPGCPAGPICDFTVSAAGLTVLAQFGLLPPSIASVTPSVGTTRGGTHVTLRGTAFTALANVTIGEAEGLDVTVPDPTTLTFRTPPLSAGLKTITVRNSDGQTATLSGAFTVVATPPRNPDLDRSGRVDIYDATILTACLNVVPSSGSACWNADLDDSGTIDRADLDILKAAYGRSGFPSRGTLTVRGASIARPNPVGTTIWFDVVDDTIDVVHGAVVTRNDEPFAPAVTHVSATSIRIDSALLDGRNRFEVMAMGKSGRRLFLEVTLWAGQLTIAGVLRNEPVPVTGATVTVTIRDEEEELTWVVAVSPTGGFQLPNLPARTVALTIRTADGRVIGTAVPADVGIVDMRMPAVLPPSSVDNNDLSLGLAGWSGDGTIRIVEHEEGVGSPLPLATAVNNDIEVTTQGFQPRHLTRVFTVKPGTKSVTVRYRFKTSEVLHNFYGSGFDDSYSITLTTRQAKGMANVTQSMNANPLTAFNQAGATAWRELTVPVAETDEVVQLDVYVSNIKDQSYPSSVIVDYLAEETVLVIKSSLYDLDKWRWPLRYLSVSPHAYLNGETPIHGELSLEGKEGDAVTDVALEILWKGDVVATAGLTETAKAVLLLPFGTGAKVETPEPIWLFTLTSDEAAGIPDTEDGQLELRVAVTTLLGGQVTANVAKVGLLAGLNPELGVPRYGEKRDEDKGGDDWARPSVINYAINRSEELSYNDFSNMHAGSFEPDHASHREGRDVDARFPGYDAMDADVAQVILALLNDPEFGRDIVNIYVTCVDDRNEPKEEKRQGCAGTKGDVLERVVNFWIQLEGEQVLGGRLATTIVRHVPGHGDHLHIRFKAKK